MDNTLTECAAVDETVVFLNYFKDLHDPRQQRKVCYPLEEILLLCLLAVVAGAETVTEIAIFGARKLDLLAASVRSVTARPRTGTKGSGGAAAEEAWATEKGVTGSRG